jgi:transposase-like protein
LVDQFEGGPSAPVGYRFPREVIAVAVRWYLRYGLSYRDVEELMAERCIDVDHVTIYRWLQTFTPESIDAARATRHVTEQYATNLIESEHGRLKAQLRPKRGLKRLLSAGTIAAGHAFVQNLRRGPYAITADLPVRDRLRVAFDEPALFL